MSPCHPFRPVPGQCGPNRRGPLPAPPFNPQDYWATRKCVSRLSASLGTKLDKADVVDPGVEAEAGQAADAKSTYEELNRVLGVASDARVLAESKADKATTLAGYGITDAATKEELAVKADLVEGKVPAAQLPSYVDDVLEYGSKSEFPASGENGKIYVAKDTNIVYRWSGTQYVEISPSPALDNTVTEYSPNGVKSSGIWSAVWGALTALPDGFSSLYDWCTAQLAALQDGKSDKATTYTKSETNSKFFPRVSDVESADPGILSWGGTPVDQKLILRVGTLKVPQLIVGRKDFSDKQDLVDVVGILKGDGLGIISAATKSSTSSDPANADYRDPQDNTCHKTEVYWTGDYGIETGLRFTFSNFEGYLSWNDGSGHFLFTKTGETYSDFLCPEDWTGTAYVGIMGHAIESMATRHSVCTVGEKFVTSDVVDGKVSSAVSTNNPAFVSAVQNTPTSGMPEDMPTDWGTYGTVGAALAALAAGLKWIKNILGSVASGYSTFAEWIASKYTKPSGGIPASDLALTVQNSLDAADAAAPQATTYTKDETDAAIRAGASLGQMTNLGNGRYEYTGALEDASTKTYPREEA